MNNNIYLSTFRNNSSNHGDPRSSSGQAGSANSPAQAAAALAAASSLQSLLGLPNLSKLTPAQQQLLQAQLQQLAQSISPISQPQPAHMLPFTAPLLYQYSALMQGAQGKSNSNVANANVNDIHRQYLLDMIPPRGLTQQNSRWKT